MQSSKFKLPQSNKNLMSQQISKKGRCLGITKSQSDKTTMCKVPTVCRLLKWKTSTKGGLVIYLIHLKYGFRSEMFCRFFWSSRWFLHLRHSSHWIVPAYSPCLPLLCYHSSPKLTLIFCRKSCDYQFPYSGARVFTVVALQS